METAVRAQKMLDSFARANVLASECPSRQVLQHLTSRWGVLVMAVLATGTFRFAQLRRKIDGVSERMLAQTLQQLEQDGFVLRHDHGEVPPRVDYTLTPLGEEAAGHLVGLVAWIEESMPRVKAAQAAAAPDGDADAITPSVARSVPATA